MPLFIDTHAHIYLNTDKSEKDIISNFLSSWWKYIICIWTDLESSKKCVDLAKKYDFVFATIWIHPSDTIKYIWKLKDSINELENIYRQNKNNIVWIWECWLDYFHTDKSDTETIQNQKDFFTAQINLANKHNLPVIIHNRESKDDVLQIIRETNLTNFIMHCYAENLDYAKKLFDFAPKCMISFSWIVTFKNAKDIQETAKNIPLKNILIETDSPFLTPDPYRWKEENEASFTKYVLKKIVNLREKESSWKIETQIYANSMKIFWIK